MPKLRIAPQWLSEALWIVDDENEAEAVDIDELGLSDELADRIDAWVDAYDAIYDADNPAASKFPDTEAERRWQTEAKAIVAAAKRELGPDWTVELSI